MTETDRARKPPTWGGYSGNLAVDEKGRCPACGRWPFNEDGPCCERMWGANIDEPDEARDD